jgi:Uma2 family endonuclease
VVIEVSASSIDYDRDVKGTIYATSGIAEHWIADLNANVVWRYSSPDRSAYQQVEVHHRGQSIAPLQLPACVVPVDAFLIE